MANSTNLTYSRKLERNIQNVITSHNILVKEFISIGGTIHTYYCNQFHCELEHALLVIKTTSIQKLLYHNIFCIHLVGFARTKSHLKNLKVFGKRCITIWVHSQLGCHNRNHDTLLSCVMSFEVKWVFKMLNNERGICVFMFSTNKCHNVRFKSIGQILNVLSKYKPKRNVGLKNISRMTCFHLEGQNFIRNIK